MFRKLCFTALLIFSLTSLTQAQSLSECLSQARANNAELKSAELQVQRSKQLESSAFDPGKTSFTLSQDPTSGGSPDNAITLSQTFDFPTVYARKKKLLKANTQVEESRRLIAEAQLEHDVCEAYCTLLLWQNIEALLMSNDSVINEFVNTAEIHFNNGNANRLELLNAKRMKSENQMRLREAKNEKNAASSWLQELMNTSEKIVATDSFQCVSLSADSYNFATTPQGKLAENERIRSEQELRLAKQGFAPELTVGVSSQLVISGINPYDVDRSRYEKGNWMGFEVGVALPLFFGATKSQKKAAKIDLDIAQTNAEAMQRKSETELSVATTAVETATESYLYYKSEGLPAAREMRQLSRTEYNLGEISYIEHIQNLNAALEIEMDNAKATDALNQAIIKLNFIKGQQQ